MTDHFLFINLFILLSSGNWFAYHYFFSHYKCPQISWNRQQHRVAMNDPALWLCANFWVYNNLELFRTIFKPNCNSHMPTKAVVIRFLLVCLNIELSCLGQHSYLINTQSNLILLCLPEHLEHLQQVLMLTHCTTNRNLPDHNRVLLEKYS